MNCGAQWNCICGECPLPGRNIDSYVSTIRELRQKLAIAGVEGSPPPGGEDTTIGTLLTRAQNAEAQVALLWTALEMQDPARYPPGDMIEARRAALAAVKRK